ncbi:MAG: hypothetical protein CMN56_11820 [Sneathiella sp.]|uniref:hypothetical protein n=1 Tax=Sneathiella sp. TaxID=1964365 RepID=UPI000C5F36EC|nr:hypothetical protein [Sneathiella sp.]MAZ03815.1 hypothetical protein [Sneathiella sp.]|tara:strand:+ start:185 stop:544 length:360 start_codon:yes stop_codon:yes gene_type:complete
MQHIQKLAICGLAFFTVSSCTVSDDYLPASIAAFEAKDCEPVVEQAIDKADIDRGKISKIEYLKHVISESDAGEEYNYQGWVNFNNCNGNYVVDMNRYCQIQTTYPRGNCKMQDIVAQK